MLLLLYLLHQHHRSNVLYCSASSLHSLHHIQLLLSLHTSCSTTLSVLVCGIPAKILTPSLLLLRRSCVASSVHVLAGQDTMHAPLAHCIHCITYIADTVAHHLIHTTSSCTTSCSCVYCSWCIYCKYCVVLTISLHSISHTPTAWYCSPYTHHVYLHCVSVCGIPAKY